MEEITKWKLCIIVMILLFLSFRAWLSKEVIPLICL